MKRKKYLLASFDSFVSSGAKLLEHFSKQGHPCQVLIAKTRKDVTRTAIPEQVRSSYDCEFTTLPSFVEECREGTYQNCVVLNGLDSGNSRYLFGKLAEIDQKRLPLCVSYLPGLLLKQKYDTFLSRISTGLLLTASRKDQSDYQTMCRELGLNASNAFLFGTVNLLGLQKTSARGSGPIVFFEQAIFPASLPERQYVCKGMCRLAAANPDRQFVIKPRVGRSNVSIHKTRFHFETILESFSDVPANLSLSHLSATELLEMATGCLTISSTVAMEALHMKVPTLLISDFGLSDDYGQAFFLGSGLFRKFSDIDLSNFPTPSEDWVRQNLEDPNGRIGELISTIENDYETLKTQSFSNAAWFKSDLLDYMMELGFDDHQIAKLHYKRGLPGLTNRIRDFVTQFWFGIAKLWP